KNFSKCTNAINSPRIKIRIEVPQADAFPHVGGFKYLEGFLWLSADANHVALVSSLQFSPFMDVVAEGEEAMAVNIPIVRFVIHVPFGHLSQLRNIAPRHEYGPERHGILSAQQLLDGGPPRNLSVRVTVQLLAGVG